MIPIIVTVPTHNAIVPVSTSESPTPQEDWVAPALQPGEVVALDIIKAENWGVMAGFQRHMGCEPKVKVKVALEIMEALFPTYRAKVCLFVEGHGEKLFTDLDDSALKADFAIRVARMLDRKEDQGAWCQMAMVLLQNETTRDQCPKSALEMLAMIWAEVGNHEQTIHWLAAAKSNREKYKEAIYKFFLEGAFDDGLAILDRAPPKENNEDDFIELIAYGLRNKEKYEDSDYRMSVFKYQDEDKHRWIILRVLCHLSHRELALALSKEMVLSCNYLSPMLSLSNYITEGDEREAYVDALCEAAMQVDERKEETKDYGQLRNLVMRENITTYEAITLAYWIQTPASRVTALWERACSISLRRDKSADDLKELQTILKAILTHLAMTKASDCVYDYWQKVLEWQVRYGFFEDAKALEAPWRDWRKVCGESQYKSSFQREEVHVLCYFALLKYLDGNTQGAVIDLMEGAAISNALCEENFNRRDCINDYIESVVRDLLRGPQELTLLQNMVCRALMCNPRSCEQIFKLERELKAITPLNQACINLVQSIDKIIKLTQQSLVKRTIQTLQYKILTQKVIVKLEYVESAAEEAAKTLAAYRECFREQDCVALANGLEVNFQNIQVEWDGYWSLRKIRKYILPLERELLVLIQKLADQVDTFNTELNKLSRE